MILSYFMKTNITLSIEFELAELLKKEDNYSRLVNDLIDNHFHETPNFKKQRLIQRAKQVNTQQVLLKEEEDKINLEMKAFVEEQSNPNKPKELIEINKVKTFTRQGAIEREDRVQEDEAQ